MATLEELFPEKKKEKGVSLNSLFSEDKEEKGVSLKSLFSDFSATSSFPFVKLINCLFLSLYIFPPVHNLVDKGT